MVRVLNKRNFLLLVATMFFCLAAYAKVTGPDAAYTGAPGDIGNCVQCHDTFHEANIGPGSVRIEDNPLVYVPGQNYTLTVRVQQGGQSRYGFQLTAIDSSGNRAGTFSSLAGDTDVHPDTGFGGREYIEHTQAGTFPTGAGMRFWRVGWTAPATDVGTVRFYVAGNGANGDNTNQNDYIYTNAALSESASTKVDLTLLSQPAGAVLQAGSSYLIEWSATNPSNVDSFEVRYSTDDGMTFPITNLIFSTVDSSITSHQWVVPNSPTQQARIRIQAATKAGTAIEVKSGKFSIGGTAGPLPQITNAFLEGKTLFISGENFQSGAVVKLNGTEIRTANLADFSHQLKCKKAAKQIPPGDTVSLVVMNPNGDSSMAFAYMRPPG